MLSQQAGACRRLVDALDPYALVARRFARDDGDVASRQVEGVREERDERLVRRAFDRRRRKTNQDSIAPQAVDTVSGRAGNHANGDNGRASWRLSALQESS